MDDLTDIVDSFEWIIKDDLRKIARRINTMYSEARISGAGEHRADRYIAERVQKMFNEVRSEA